MGIAADETLAVFHKNLSTAFANSGMTLAELERASKYNYHSIGKLLKGENDPKFTNVIKVAQALDQDLPSLFSDEYEYSRAESFQPNDYLTIFFENINRWLSLKNLTHIYISANTGISLTTISLNFGMKKVPKLSTVVRMGTATGLNLKQLLRRGGVQ